MVDLTGDVPLVRRVGAVSIEQLQAVLPEIEVPEELRPAAPVELTKDAAPAAADTTDDADTADPAPEEAGAGRPPMIEVDPDAAPVTDDSAPADHDASQPAASDTQTAPRDADR